MEYYEQQRVLKELQISEDELQHLISSGKLQAFPDQTGFKFSSKHVEALKKEKTSYSPYVDEDSAPTEQLIDHDSLELSMKLENCAQNLSQALEYFSKSLTILSYTSWQQIQKYQKQDPPPSLQEMSNWIEVVNKGVESLAELQKLTVVIPPPPPRPKSPAESEKKTVPPTPHPPQPNKLPGLIGHYQIIRLLGKGGMGQVALAKDVRHNMFVAIKFFSQSHLVERIAQEAGVHAKLHHPNIVRIIEVNIQAKKPYMVMEYIEGETLKQAIKRTKRLSPRHTLQIAFSVLQALEYAFGLKVVHRDVKPANILIDNANHKVKLADFGLAKILNKENPLTPSRVGMGSFYYMPPEQSESAKEVDHRADIYSLGATMYHMLCGQAPYSEHKGSLQILKAVLRREVIPISEFCDAPKYITSIIEKAMSKKVDDRYQNYTHMIYDIKQALEKVLENE